MFSDDFSLYHSKIEVLTLGKTNKNIVESVRIKNKIKLKLLLVAGMFLFLAVNILC